MAIQDELARNAEEMKALKSLESRIGQVERSLAPMASRKAMNGLSDERRGLSDRIRGLDLQRKRLLREARERLAALLGYTDPAQSGGDFDLLDERTLISHIDTLEAVEAEEARMLEAS